MTAIERAIAIIGAIPGDENIERNDFLSAIAGYLEGQLKEHGKMKDASKGYKYKTRFIDSASGEKSNIRFKLKDGKITIKLRQSKKEKEKE